MEYFLFTKHPIPNNSISNTLHPPIFKAWIPTCRSNQVCALTGKSRNEKTAPLLTWLILNVLTTGFTCYLNQSSLAPEKISLSLLLGDSASFTGIGQKVPHSQEHIRHICT